MADGVLRGCDGVVDELRARGLSFYGTLVRARAKLLRAPTAESLLARLGDAGAAARLGEAVELVVLGEGAVNPHLVKATVGGGRRLDVCLLLAHDMTALVDVADGLGWQVHELLGMGSRLEVDVEAALAQWEEP